MRPDDVLTQRREWRKWNYGHLLPDATLLATRDWLSYVQAMAAALPQDNAITQVSEEDARWSWPGGLTIICAEPVELEHLIVNNTYGPVTPHVERQLMRGMMIGPAVPTPAQDSDGVTLDVLFPAHPIMFIGDNPDDTITSHWIPGTMLHRRDVNGEVMQVSESSRFTQALLTALGHRLTRIAMPSGPRGERRRAERELPGLRVLELQTGATVKAEHEPSTVHWTRRWIVRGHWRLQPYGPRRELRRLRWIDPYVKGPEDLPLDARLTIWRA